MRESRTNQGRNDVHPPLLPAGDACAGSQLGHKIHLPLSPIPPLGSAPLAAPLLPIGVCEQRDLFPP